MSQALTPHQAAAQALAKQRDSSAARLAGLSTGEGMQFVKGKAGRWTFPDGDVVKNEITVVVLDWAYHYSFWPKDQPYDPNNQQPPVCVAVGQSAGEMRPSDNSIDKQHEGPCATCPQNQFGSGGGNRKACKNSIVLAFKRYDDEIEDDTIYFLGVPPSALKGWGQYVSKLAQAGRAPAEVVTVVAFDEKVDYPKPVFTADARRTKEYLEVDEDGNSYFAAFVTDLDKATQTLLREPTFNRDED